MMKIMVGDRVRVLDNKNGAYKNLEGTVVKLEDHGAIRVTFDERWRFRLSDLGYVYKNAIISKGSYNIIGRRLKSYMEVE